MSPRFLMILLLGLTCSVSRASDARCPRTALHELVERGDDLYLGEIHGTVEAPALVRCLVEAAITRGKERVIVSLEHDESARDRAGDLWRGTDGRSSAAMWELMRFVLEQEKAGRVELHLQLRDVVVLVGDPPRVDMAEYERRMGEPLRVLAARGQLIALSGNVHAAKEALPGLGYRPAGAYAGSGVVHIALQPAQGGASWSCTSNASCGEHDLGAGSSLGARPGELTGGKLLAYDHFYGMPRLTASPPKLPAR